MEATTNGEPPNVRDGSHDFDFFAGRWSVKHRRLDGRLVGSTRWEEFGGTTHVTLLMNGSANVDDNVIDLPSGAFRAVTFRVYDAANDLWSIWWVDGRTSTLDTPVRGRFADGIGVFECDDVLDGRRIRVRFTWSGMTASAARWEQAFSADGGDTWESNWVMEFARIDA